MNIKDNLILEQYRSEKDKYVRLGAVVQKRLQEIAGKSSVSVMSVGHRLKDEKSLCGKLYRKGEKYRSLEDITDILGARIVCYFYDDVDVLGKQVEKSFVVDWENSVDKRKQMRADSFGYLSLHYICSLPKDAGFPQELCDVRFEIQIRTIMQHVWSEINHDLGYKSDFGMPRAVIRQFARLAGMFEIIDEEFMRVRDGMNAYTSQTRKKIQDDKAQDVLMDNVSLREYMLYNKKIRAFLERIAGIEGSEITEISPESYVPQLKWLKKNSIGDVQSMLSENEDLAFELARKSLAGSELDVVASTVALRFLCRAELLSKNYTEQQAVEFILLSVSDKKRAERQAEMLFRQKEEL